MKTIDDYMKKAYRMEIVEDKDEGGFIVTYPDLPERQLKVQWQMQLMQRKYGLKLQ